MDRKLFRKKFLLHLLGNSSVIFPFAAGVSMAFAAWVFSLEPKILYLFGSAVLSLLVPIGTLISKWATGTEDIAKQVHHELLQEVQQKQETELNRLHEQLEADGDSRTERMLEELRGLHKSFQEEATGEGWLGTLPIRVRADITDKISELFTQAVQCLKDTLKMHQKSSNTHLATVKSVLEQHREQQITDVHQTIVQLSHLYARLLTMEKVNETDLMRLRTELDESLTFAKQVDAKIRELTHPDPTDVLQTEDTEEQIDA